MDSLKIAEIAEEYRAKPGALIQVFQEIHALENYLPPAAIRLAADKLGIPHSKAFSVATFYSSFRLEPKGRHTVTLCVGTVCYLKGSKNISESIQREFQVKPNGTSPDGEFTLLHVNCLGACAMAPVMMVDGKYHGGLSAGSAVGTLRKVAAGESVGSAS